MATTFTKLSSTAHSVKYAFFTDAPGGSAFKIQADIAADCESGPLRELLEGASSIVWSALPSSRDVSVYVTPDDPSANSGPPAIQFLVFPNNQLKLSAPAGAIAAGFVEIRYHNSMVR